MKKPLAKYIVLCRGESVQQYHSEERKGGEGRGEGVFTYTNGLMLMDTDG